MICVSLAAVPLVYSAMTPDRPPAESLIVPKERLLKLVALLLLGLWSLARLGRRPARSMGAAGVLLAAFVAWYALSAALSPAFVPAFAALQLVVVFATFFGVVATTPGAPRATLVGIAGAGLTAAITIGAQECGLGWPGVSAHDAITGPAGTFLHRNRAAYVIALAAPLWLYALLASRHRWQWAGAWLALVLASYGLLAARSRGAWTATLLAIVLLLAWRAWRRQLPWRQSLLAAAAPLGVVAIVALTGATAPSSGGGTATPGVARVEALGDRVHDFGSLQLRLQLWSDAWTLARAQPVFGVGPGQFATAAAPLRPTWRPLSSRNADGELPSTLAEAGVPATLLLVAFGVVVIAAVARRRRRDEAPLVFALVAGLAPLIVLEVVVRHGIHGAIVGALCGALYAGLGTDPSLPSRGR